MKRLMLGVMFALSVIGQTSADVVTNAYNFKMSLRIPRVYNNMESLGYRKVQRQTITGTLYLIYKDCESRPDIVVDGLVNKTHKLSTGQNVTYDTNISYEPFPRVNLIGNNKTCVFNTPSVIFGLEAIPSYTIGSILNEDNSLYITLSGFGTTKKVKSGRVINTVRGSVVGTLGCGCTDYGHTSPTRIAGPFWYLNFVDDVATVDGTWLMKYNSKLSN